MRVSAMPGIVRMRRSSSFAYFWLACWFGPLTCTSIGAGAPKFRIWLTISAGRNENVVPGKRRGSCVRNSRTYRAVGACDFASEIRMSPSCGPIVPLLLYVRLMPLLGRPMLSITLAS